MGAAPWTSENVVTCVQPEVETKFFVTKLALLHLEQPEKGVYSSRAERKYIYDQYLDCGDASMTLASQGYYLRLRNGEPELKIRIGGDDRHTYCSQSYKF
jgi:inorganic triphosphatase YgiF